MRKPNQTRQPGKGGRKSARNAWLRVNDQPLKPRGSAWRNWLVLVGLAVVLGVLAIPNRDAIGGYLNRPLDTLRLETLTKNVPEGEVTSRVAAYMGEGFFEIDVNEVKRSLESHPWVARARVNRVWPSTLMLAIEEEVPIARWGDTSLLNQFGQAITPDPRTIDATLPLLSGPERSHVRMMEQYQGLNQILFPAGLRLEELVLTDRDSWELVVAGGTRIVAGKADVRERLKRFVAIYDNQFGNDIADIEKIDLRYSNGFTVKKREPESQEVAAR